MLTLEQVRAVNDGLIEGDLNAALKPLEETIDLRVAELPRLDKRAVAALKDGLQSGDDAATWAQAILHPNVSVRRFARKVFMGLGDEAAPVFAPLRARLEQFWAEEEPLPETNKPREAARRREQNEKLGSALEILLRADPEAFLEFYGQLVDANLARGRAPQAAITEWHRRNSEANEATRNEVNRLLKAEWGEEWMKTGKRYKLPTRILLDLNAKARQKPEIAAMWAELGDYSEVAGTAEWNIIALLDGARGAYLHADKPSARAKRVNARLQPILMRWLEGAFDWQTTPDERERMARRFLQNNYGQTTGGLNIEELPSFLLRNRAPLERPLRELMASEAGYHTWISREGDDLLALLWLYLAMGLSRYLGRLHGFNASSFETPAMEPAVLRQIIEGLPQTWVSRMVLDGLESGAKAIEHREKSANASEVAEAMPINVVEVVRARAAGLTLHEAQAQKREEEAARNREMLALDADARIARLVDPAAESGSVRRLPQRLTIWNVMAHSMGGDGFALVKKELWPRAEPLLWARFETQLEAHRRVETEPIEPSLEQKLTPAEIKQWQTRARQEKRQWIANDINDIAAFMAQVNGLAARVKSVKLANRPSCREIYSRLKADLFVELQQLPQGYNFRSVKDASVEAWENWKLDQSWDEVLADAELDLSQAKDEWARNTLSRQLAAGYYRRGKLAKFERHATRPEAFPFTVAAGVVALDDFEAWRILIRISPRWQETPLTQFWHAQKADEERRARALEAAVRTISQTNFDDVGKTMIEWLNPLAPSAFEPHLAEIENAFESPLIPVKRWAMSALTKVEDYDRERAAQTAGEMLWSENAGLAKDAVKFLAFLSLQDENAAQVAWDSLNDATSLENIGLCEAIYRALVKIKSKRKALELSDAARGKLKDLSAAQADRFGKFVAKLN